MSETDSKRAFVTNYLAPLLVNADRSGIASVEYFANDGGEYVVATMSSGRQREINVTGDSETALIKDVIRALADSEWD